MIRYEWKFNWGDDCHSARAVKLQTLSVHSDCTAVLQSGASSLKHYLQTDTGSRAQSITTDNLALAEVCHQVADRISDSWYDLPPATFVKLWKRLSATAKNEKLLLECFVHWASWRETGEITDSSGSGFIKSMDSPNPGVRTDSPPNIFLDSHTPIFTFICSEMLHWNTSGEVDKTL